MKKFSALLVAALLSISVQSSVSAAGNTGPLLEPDITERVTEAQWDAFSARLVDALGSDNVALQQSALRLIIKHGASVDVHDGLFDVARMYRDGNDVQLRRMAVVALASMDSAWAMDYLKRSVSYEKSDPVRHTISAILATKQG